MYIICRYLTSYSEHRNRNKPFIYRGHQGSVPKGHLDWKWLNKMKLKSSSWTMYNVHHLYADTELLSARLLIILSMARYSHRYLWTGPYVAPFILLLFFFKMLPPPLFFNIDFFHINNILQLSMYHCMTYIQYIQSSSSFYPCRVSDMI
jgi:hypothetical protein